MQLPAYNCIMLAAAHFTPTFAENQHNGGSTSE